MAVANVPDEEKRTMTAYEPLVSVIIPIYKVADTMDRCLKSVTLQTYDNLQIIMVDDGSPDSCPEKCDQWAESDGRITVVHQDNGGLSAARNTGLDIAKGEYYMFVDSDDFIEPTCIESLLAAAVRYDVKLSVCSIVKEGASHAVKAPAADEESVVSAADFFRRSPWHWEYIVAWNKLYAESLWNNVRFPVGRIHEDEYVFHRIIMQCDRIAVLPEPLYHYVFNSESIMHTSISVARLDRCEARIARMAFYASHGFRDLVPVTWGFVVEDIDAVIRQLSMSRELKARVVSVLGRLSALPCRSLRGLPWRSRCSIAIAKFSPSVWLNLHLAGKDLGRGVES